MPALTLMPAPVITITFRHRPPRSISATPASVASRIRGGVGVGVGVGSRALFSSLLPSSLGGCAVP